MSEEQRKSDIIWNLIENARFELFGLPNQVVHDYFKRLDVTDDELHLVLKPSMKGAAPAGAAVPALDELLGALDLRKFDGQRLELTQADNGMIAIKFV